MLNVMSLETEIKKIFDDTLPGAFEQCILSIWPEKTDMGDKQAKEIGKNMCKMLSEDWSKRLAAAIDYYIKAGCLYGTIITVGSPVTQTAVIAPVNMGNPTAGKVPNTIGIM